MIETKEKTIGKCCPRFHSEKWNNRTFHWNQKQFLLASVPTLFHIPFPPMIGKRITKMMEKAEAAHKTLGNKEDVLLLFTDPSAFKSEMYLSVTGKVPEAKNTTITGTFKSKVFEGSYNGIPKFMKKMDAYLKAQNEKAKQYYVHYAYCPTCAKEAGHNYIVLFAELEE